MLDEPLPSPATQAITAGRAASGRSLAPALWASSTWESESLDDANRRATGSRQTDFYSRYCNPTVRSFEEAGARSRRRRGVAGVRLGHGGDLVDHPRLVFDRESRGRAAPAVRRNPRVPAGPLRPPRHRDHVRRRRDARRVHRGGAARSHDGGARRDAVESSAGTRRPRRTGCDHGALHRRGLDVRHASRPAATGSRCRHLVALGDQGDRRPQRCHARRDLGRCRSVGRDLGIRRPARRHAVAVRRAQRAAWRSHARGEDTPTERVGEVARCDARRPRSGPHHSLPGPE